MGVVAVMDPPTASRAREPAVPWARERVGLDVTGPQVNAGTLDGTAFMLFALLTLVASIGRPGRSRYVASRIGGLDRANAATVAAPVVSQPAC
jgi:hypothetical protein